MWATMVLEILDQPDQLADAGGDHGADARDRRRARTPASSSPSRDIVATMPGAELVVIPDAGHSPQFENPPAWREAMETFLARVPR